MRQRAEVAAILRARYNFQERAAALLLLRPLASFFPLIHSRLCSVRSLGHMDGFILVFCSRTRSVRARSFWLLLSRGCSQRVWPRTSTTWRALFVLLRGRCPLLLVSSSLLSSCFLVRSSWIRRGWSARATGLLVRTLPPSVSPNFRPDSGAAAAVLVGSSVLVGVTVLVI